MRILFMLCFSIPMIVEAQILNINNLSAESESCKEVILTWSDVSGETGYRVRRKIKGSTSFTNIKDVPSNAVQYIDNTVQASETYEYMVRPLKDGKAVALSNTVSQTISECQSQLPISDITNLKAEAISCSKVELKWSDVSGEEAYRVRRREKGGAFKILADIAAGSETYADNTVTSSKDYEYMVRPMQGGKAVKVSNIASVPTPSCGITNPPPSDDCTYWFDANGLWQGKGRIVISSDGNEHDEDDWAATPFSLALLASRGLQDKLVLYTFSDHVWGSNLRHSNATEEMIESAIEGGNQFGFTNTDFIEAVRYPNEAVNAMVDQINASTAQDPLFIVAAGPMEVIGRALNKANASKLKHVVLLSHSLWNDRHADKPMCNQTHCEPDHSGWTWDELEDKFGNIANFVHTVDQNGGNGYQGMRAPASEFSWLKNSSARNNPLYESGSWDWLISRQEVAAKKDEWDPSDAGMIIYLLTGVEKTDPQDAKALMVNPVAPCEDEEETEDSSPVTPVNTFIKAYPNPTSGVMTLPEVYVGDKLSVVNQISGLVVLRKTISTTGATEIDITSQPNGLYMIQIIRNNELLTRAIQKL